jgi:uncharacterized DUF497 family protein
MDVIYWLQELVFEWDERKARSNVEKHGVTFEEAAEVFLDPFREHGDASVGGEDRDFVAGYSLAQHMLLVVYVERSTATRIISARAATRAERKRYERRR